MDVNITTILPEFFKLWEVLIVEILKPPEVKDLAMIMPPGKFSDHFLGTPTTNILKEDVSSRVTIERKGQNSFEALWLFKRKVKKIEISFVLS